MSRALLPALSFLLGTLASTLLSCGGEESKELQGRAPKGADVTAAGEPKKAVVVPGVGDYASNPTKEKPPTPLHKALQKGNLEAAKALLEEKSTDLNAQLADGLAPIHIAVGSGRAEMVALLLEKGANPNLKQAAGATALQIAIDTNRLDIVDLLLAKDADPNAQDKDKGLGPLHLACTAPGLETAGRIALAGKLLAKGANIDLPMKNGATPLHLACERDNLELATFLLDRGAKTDVRGPEGYTALHFAAAKKSKPLCELLVSRGADVNAKNDGKATPAQIAAYDQNAELFEFFQTHGAKFE